MIEFIIGIIAGAGMMVLFLHFTKRLKPLPSAEASYNSGNHIAALGIDISGDRNGPKLDLNLDPIAKRRLVDVLPDLGKYL